MAKKGEWHTPICALKNKEEVWTKLEQKGWTAPNLNELLKDEDKDKEITFFNNPLKYQWSAEYDRFFAYTKKYPLWDQRKLKDNCQYPPDIQENIYQQEGFKAVPVLTSLNYGLASRPLMDLSESEHRRWYATNQFKRRQGVKTVVEKKPQ